MIKVNSFSIIPQLKLKLKMLARQVLKIPVVSGA